MSAETDLLVLLKAAAPVTALVGSGAAARIRSNRAEEDDPRPFVVYERSATEVFKGLDGTIFDTKVTLAVQCWGDTRAQAEALADACQAAIEAADQTVAERSGGYDGELDLEASVLTVEWWE